MSSKTFDLWRLIWGFPLKNMTVVHISSEQSISELKSIVSKELSLGPDLFSLHKMCRDLPEGTVYPDEVVNIQTLPTVSLNGTVGDLFHDALPNNAPHFVVYVSDPVWMTGHMETIKLSCLILPGTTTSDFSITIPKREKVIDLKKKIKAAQSILETAKLAQIELYDVSIPAYELARDELAGDEQALRHFTPTKAGLEDSQSLYSLFPYPQPSHIHVIVKVSGRLRPELPTRYLADRREAYHAFVHDFAQVVPSSTAQPEQFREFQEVPERALHCNRGSTDNATPSLPLTLLHPVFGTFMEECRMLVPDAEHNHFAAKFIGKMRLLYAQEDTRDNKTGRAPTARELFSEWGLPFQQSIIETASGKEFRTDGDLKESLSGCRYGILEVENEIGSGNTEPYAQACFCYQQACLEQFCKTSSVLPCLLVLVYGAAWNVHPTVEILSVVPLFHDPYFPSDAKIQTTVARHLLAMKNALRTLLDYYQTSYPPHDSTPIQLFPYATSYSQGNQSQKFEYLEQIQANLIFRGRLLGAQQNIWIKFVRSYSPEAHQWCQEKGHAPKLLGLRNLDGDWVMVVMEDLAPDYLTLNKICGTLPVSLMDGIRQTIKELHEAGFVHGDLRDLNIMVHKQDKNKFMIVDWDWSGVNRVARYPPNVNQEVKRPAGAIDGQLILPTHDLDMLNYMEKAYWGESGAVRKRASTLASEELPRKVPRTGPF